MEPPISNVELDAIEARCSAASPGPWREWVEAEGGLGGCDVIIVSDDDKEPDMYVYRDKIGGGLVPVSAADLHFIGHARTDLPRLAAEVRRLRSVVEERQTRE